MKTMPCFLFLFSVLALMGCQQETPIVTAPSSTSKTMNSEKDNSTETPVAEFVIDVRTQKEWDAGHLEEAIRIEHTEIADRIEEITKDKSAKILLYCKMGGRAGLAKEALEKMGYSNVENGGGFEDLKNQHNQ
ncbi:MAG: rhodanese-like domain-containing protein [Mariniblastus sp.]|nr:rhodanese-like domain-containing protein [Mariniblastus sp.]